MFKTAAIALLCALSLFAVFDPGEARAKKPANSYTLECVLRSGCHFTCLAASGVKIERVFDEKNVKSVDFIEFGRAAVATIFVSNEQPSTFRLSGTVFYEIPNSLVR